MIRSISKRTMAAIAILLSPTVAFARDINNTVKDSVETKQLDEIIVQAPKVIRKPDMDVYYPSKSAVSNSVNGIQLLSNLMVPSLSVTEALGSVKAVGQAVQLRINGRVSSFVQVKALRPETVKKVEWIDNPGLRYNGASYVLNFIVTNPSAGGSLQTEGRQALNTAWGDYFIDSKFNNGRSQFEFSGVFKLTNKVKSHRDYKETFTFPDGSSLTRTESPLGGYVDNTFGRISGSYSYIKTDTTTLELGLSIDPSAPDYWVSKGLLSLNDGSEEIFLTDSHGTKGTTPEISAYLEHHFSANHTIVIDFSSSLYYGKSYSDYIERPSDQNSNLTNIHTSIKDRNQAYGFEADYIGKWGENRLTSGLSYTANRNRSVYESLGGEVFHQRQDYIYLFSEYFRRLNKVTLTIGLGARYASYLFKETGMGNHSWNFMPQATVSYRPSLNHQFRLSFRSRQTAPSLAESNATPQQIDGFQWRVGNPRLKSARSFSLSLGYNFNLPRVTGSFSVSAFTSPDAITPHLFWDGGKLITSYENSRGLQNITLSLSPQIEIIPDWLTLSGLLLYRAERMKGHEYMLYNHNWSGNLNILLSHWGFVLLGQYVRADHTLLGEKISWGESLSIVQLSYYWRRWQFGAGVIMPFGKYDKGAKLLSKWNKNEHHMRIDMRMPYISITYNIRWGRQKASADKLINIDANIDRSAAGGR